MLYIIVTKFVVIVPTFFKLCIVKMKSEVCLIVVIHNTHVISERVITMEGRGKHGGREGGKHCGQVFYPGIYVHRCFGSFSIAESQESL